MKQESKIQISLQSNQYYMFNEKILVPLNKVQNYDVIFINLLNSLTSVL